MLQIHQDIQERLDKFIECRNIPHIIFYGPSGSGKRTIVHNFVRSIYQNDQTNIKNYVMSVDCAHGKGIKFIREDLKFFAKTHIDKNNGYSFKTIILSNADKLTTDAQSALRRCIEVFSHNTRFFIIVEDKYRLLKPILSRFCEIYVPEPELPNCLNNLHEYKVLESFKLEKDFKQKTLNLKKILDKELVNINYLKLKDLSLELYESGYSAIDILNYIKNLNDRTQEQISLLLLFFNKIKKEFRCEKLLIYFILYFTFIRSDYPLENIGFI